MITLEKYIDIHIEVLKMAMKDEEFEKDTVAALLPYSISIGDKIIDDLLNQFYTRKK